MPEGPFGGPRPFASVNRLEVNLTFVGSDIPDNFIDIVREEVETEHAFEGPVKGPVGTLNSTVTFASRGNQITFNNLENLRNRVEDRTDVNVEGIEIIG